MDLNLEADEQEDDLITCESLTSLASHVLKEVEVLGSTSIESEVEEMLSTFDWKPPQRKKI